MTFIEAVKLMADGEVMVLDNIKYRMNELGFIEEYEEETLKDWVPVIFELDDYLSENWEVKYEIH